MNIQATLAERGTRYGDYSGHARITQNLKRAMCDSRNWSILSDDKREALEMVAHKIGRILNGDPDYHDSWHDIIGYTQLVADALAHGKKADVIDLSALRTVLSDVPRIGELWPEEGGIYVGIMRGEAGKPDYHLIVPVDAHTTDIAWGGEGKDEPDAQSHWDGRANTAALCASKHKHPAAKWAAELQIDGHCDLYLPALRELRLCWANVPELFESTWYWTSTQSSSGYAWIQGFNRGSQDDDAKGYKSRARAVRRREI